MALVACQTPTPLPQANQLTVVASFYPLYEFARQAGGDRVQVSSLVPTGVEPHEWEPLPREVVRVSQADLFVYNGAGLEPWSDRIVKDLKGDRPVVLVATAGIALRRAEDGDEDGPLDPHVWLDPVRAQQQVQAISAALQRLDPDHAQTYATNADAYLGQLGQLDQEYLEGLRDCESRTLVTTHASFGYLASRYGLTPVAISGLNPEAEPSPGRLAELARDLKAQGVTAVYTETLVSPAVAEALAREIDAQVLDLNPIEGLTPAEAAQGKDYLSLMRENLASLRKGLRCN
jgi:zinc transport system substrate-binding protein